VKISFDTNSDSYDDALSALNAAYGVESLSASSLGAIARSDMDTGPMTREKFEALYASIPPEELRTEEDNIRLKTLFPDDKSREEYMRFRIESASNANVKAMFQFLVDEGAFGAEDAIKWANLQYGHLPMPTKE